MGQRHKWSVVHETSANLSKGWNLGLLSGYPSDLHHWRHSVNISREQAIEIALRNLATYSYKMTDQSVVKDFNVVEDEIVARLATSPQDSVLRPYWDVRMPLNQTYPGSVQGIVAFIWANSGEVISYGNLAYGGMDYGENYFDIMPDFDDTSSLEGNLSSPFPTVWVSVAIIGSAAALCSGFGAYLLRRKRKSGETL